MAMKTIVALPGEGIGIEVVDATCDLLMGTGLPLKILTPPQGSPLPEETKRAAREADGVLFGAAGPSTSPVVSWLRWEMAAWAGVRPIRFFPGMRSPLSDPDGIDYVLLRENSEGLYPGREGDLADLVRLMPDLHDRTGRTVKEFGTEGRFAVKIVTPRGAERIARFACDLARRRQARGKPGKVTLRDQVERAPPHRWALRRDRRPHRARGRPPLRALPRRRRGPPPGALPQGDGRRALHEPLRRHPVRPGRGDRRRPRPRPVRQLRRQWAYFESVHGSAPDIAGKGIANPTATILSAALMLEHMGLAVEAQRLEAAVGRVYRDGKVLTPDQGGSARTRDMAQAVLAAYR